MTKRNHQNFKSCSDRRDREHSKSSQDGGSYGNGTDGHIGSSNRRGDNGICSVIVLVMVVTVPM